jgi:hypothetical protein
MVLEELNQEVKNLRTLINKTREQASRYKEDPIWVQTCNGILNAIEDQIADIVKGRKTMISAFAQNATVTKMRTLAEVGGETAEWIHRERHPEDWDYDASLQVAQGFALIYRDCLR